MSWRNTIRSSRPTAWALLAALLLAAGCARQEAKQGAAPPDAGTLGSKAPDFELSDLSGKTVRRSDFQGKVVILDFWATWCGPCRQEVPDFVRLQAKYRQQGLVVVGLSLDADGAKAVRPFAEEFNVNYPMLLANADAAPRVRRLTIVHSLAFIVGFSLVFIALGATATVAGQFLREHQDLLRRVGGVLIILFGIFLTGWIPIPALSRERKKQLTTKPLGILGSVLVGITFAAGWTPCIGPILASILIYASTAKTVGTGVVFLSVYSLGLGLPFFLASLALNSFLAASQRIRSRLRTIEVASGVVLILFGVLLVTDLFPRFVSFLSRFLPVVG